MHTRFSLPLSRWYFFVQKNFLKNRFPDQVIIAQERKKIEEDLCLFFAPFFASIGTHLACGYFIPFYSTCAGRKKIPSVSLFFWSMGLKKCKIRIQFFFKYLNKFFWIKSKQKFASQFFTLRGNQKKDWWYEIKK